MEGRESVSEASATTIEATIAGEPCEIIIRGVTVNAPNIAAPTIAVLKKNRVGSDLSSNPHNKPPANKKLYKPC